MKWISIKDQLPPYVDHIATDGEFIYIVLIVKLDNEKIIRCFNINKDNKLIDINTIKLTHWRQFPVIDIDNKRLLLDVELQDGTYIFEEEKYIEITTGSYTKKEIRINTGFNSPSIIIDKAYGPTSAEEIKIYIDNDSNWVVERYNVSTSKWEVKSKWHIQESYEDSNEMD